jgi:hypothetical protein
MPTDVSGSEWLRRNWDQLRQYNFEWVAATEERLVQHDAELSIVMQSVISQQLQEHVVYAFVDFVESTR